MHFEFWLGLLVSIPIAIAANLVTPAVRRRFERQSAIISLKKAKRLGEDFLEVARYHREPVQLTHRLAIISMRVMHAAFASVYSIAAFGILSLVISRHPTNGLIRLTDVMMFIICLSIIMSILLMRAYEKEARELVYNVEHFEEYTKQIPQDIVNRVQGVIDNLRRQKSQQ